VNGCGKLDDLKINEKGAHDVERKGGRVSFLFSLNDGAALREQPNEDEGGNWRQNRCRDGDCVPASRASTQPMHHKN
jgi:hypothetical protein